jgi:hypothetical protein
MEVGARIPIACTLGPGEQTDRVAEWEDFARTAVTGVEVQGTMARFHLENSDEVLLAAASLSQREKECCGFFEFAIELLAGDRWLVARVPPGAEEALAGFAGHLSAPS